MSIYAQAVTSGVTFIGDLMSSGEGSAAYASGYNTMANKLRAASAKNVAERNISAVRQDKVLTNTKIQMQATQAEAMQRVQNAMIGRTGGSVTDVSTDIAKTAAQMTQSNEKATRQQEESLLASVNQSQGALLSAREEKVSMAGELMKAFSAFEFSDLKLGKDIGEAMNGKKKDKGK